MTARNVVSASAGAATATRLPTQVAARIAFLNAFIPSPPLPSRRPNAYYSGPCPVSDRTIGSIFSFTTPFDPTTLVTPALRQKSGQPSGQVLSRPAYARRRMDCSPGSAPPTRLLKNLQFKNDARI